MAEWMKLEEKMIFSLRALYESYGYRQFKMSKFEPYDFYMKNKEFLVSQRVITFTDTDGTLMALKPDVTLSIVKNYRPTDMDCQRVCYSENIYRIAGAGRTYREIMQTGLECLGAVGSYERSEVLLLALQSLKQISDQFVLDLSHLGVITDLLNRANLDEMQTSQVLACMAQKNESSLQEIPNLPPKLVSRLLQLNQLCGPILEVLERLPSFVSPSVAEELHRIGTFLQKMGYAEHVVLDFSIVSNRDYYNGLVFRGYVQGIPSEILAGGQYDNLMQKMGKQADGIGFAVYLDQLERLEQRSKDLDAEAVLLCAPDEDAALIHQVKETLPMQRVLVAHRLPQSLAGCRVFKLENGRATEIENHG